MLKRTLLEFVAISLLDPCFKQIYEYPSMTTTWTKTPDLWAATTNSSVIPSYIDLFDDTATRYTRYTRTRYYGNINIYTAANSIKQDVPKILVIKKI